MSIEKITNSIASNKTVQTIGNSIANGAEKIGEGISNVLGNGKTGDSFQKVINKFEPEGYDNSWLLMTGLMVSMVVGPRVKAAATRNPDNKEATKDEITEILFRDIQTIAIILLAQKAMNTGIGSIAGKLTGLPMTNQKYAPVLSGEVKGGISQRIKNGFKNVWDTINPIGGKRVLSNEQFIKKYSGYEGLDEINKLFTQIELEGGDKNKVFDNAIDSLIKTHDKIMSDTNGINNLVSATTDEAGKVIEPLKIPVENANKYKEELLAIKKGDYEKFVEDVKNNTISQNAQNKITNFFKNKENALVEKTIGLNAWLKTLAYAIEIIYLGFGLPALNQIRLEHKYLKNGGKKPFAPENKPQNPNSNPQINNYKVSGNVLLGKAISNKEIKLYNTFTSK